MSGYQLHISQELIRFVKQHDKLVQNIKNSSMFPVMFNLLVEQINYDITQVVRRANASAMDKSKIDGLRHSAQEG